MAHGRRLPEESFLLPRRDRDLGILYMGAQERMRLVVHRMIKGRGRMITRVGAAGAAGMGSRSLRVPSSLLPGHPVGAGSCTRLAGVVSGAG